MAEDDPYWDRGSPQLENSEAELRGDHDDPDHVNFDHNFHVTMFAFLMTVCLALFITRIIVRQKGQNQCGYRARKSPGEMNQKLMQTASYRQQEAANRAIHLKVLRMLDESSEPHSIDVNLVELQSPLSEVIIESF
ncbi:uncharacterized protein LOC142351506 [Convolutriloba macropyga]|uniref:uncharacterized protein LOC142351506 n=1 Tax=Convolutriloba macropyga TaxID=536237 RepID=UPI003F51CA42